MHAQQTLAEVGQTIPKGIFNLQKDDYTKPELFLGQPAGLLDTIHMPFTEAFKWFEKVKVSDWKHNEFDYSRCIGEFKTAPSSIVKMMIRTLAWQWEGDSAAARTLSDILLPMCTATESRVLYTRIADQENLHALTYSEIVRGSFEDPSTILQEILSVREAHGRMEVAARIFEEARLTSLNWQLTGIRGEYAEQVLLKLIIAILVFERIQFMSSFAVTFGICELRWFEPIGSAVQLIARDEYGLHVPAGETVIKYVLKTDWGMRAFQAIRQEIIELICETLTRELAWVDYLYSDVDELPGVPKDKLKEWSLFCGRGVTEFLDVTSEVENKMGHILPIKLPLGFMKDWIAIEVKQASPQEQDPNNYLVNIVSKDVSTKEIDVGIEYDF